MSPTPEADRVEPADADPYQATQWDAEHLRWLDRIDRERVAFHEAGHYVVAKHFGMHVRVVSIIDDGPAGAGCGGTILYRDRFHFTSNRALTALAGCAAEAVLDDEPQLPRLPRHEYDWQQAELIAAIAQESVEAWLPRVHALVRELWGEVETIALALVERSELNDRQGAALLREHRRRIRPATSPKRGL